MAGPKKEKEAPWGRPGDLQEVTQGKFLCEVPSFVGQNSHRTQSDTTECAHTHTHRDTCIHTDTCTGTHTDVHTHTPSWVELAGVMQIQTSW